MSNIGIFGRTFGLLEKVLDLRMQNQQVIASNIANADTPGFAPVKLEFEQGLKDALSGRQAPLGQTHEQHFPATGQFSGVAAKVVRDRSQAGVGDGNGVDLDKQMVDLSENQILYEAATQMINKKLGLLKYVAQDGR